MDYIGNKQYLKLFFQKLILSYGKYGPGDHLYVSFTVSLFHCRKWDRSKITFVVIGGGGGF